MLRPISVTLAIVLLLPPSLLSAQDRWFGRDKMQHFAATAAIGGGGYALAASFTPRTRSRVVSGLTAGIGVAAAKELRDRKGGDPSWRDFVWGVAGTSAGVLIAHGIAKLRR